MPQILALLLERRELEDADATDPVTAAREEGWRTLMRDAQEGWRTWMRDAEEGWRTRVRDAEEGWRTWMRDAEEGWRTRMRDAEEGWRKRMPLIVALLLERGGMEDTDATDPGTASREEGWRTLMRDAEEGWRTRMRDADTAARKRTDGGPG
ncbi:hypothetical protein NDU88_007311 [Pleurodeles waltl]|uniref:Uncharacterized protein n=1 Tax=Pleurodeles waltl TaxID=8319 RepID=A0AAV7WF21_PLEWA|nr:hypothetical protein NDU88_007311 [Pleurodeles waltl]